MRKMLCAFLTLALILAPAAFLSGARADAGSFQPKLDTDTSCEITVVGTGEMTVDEAVGKYGQ